LKKKKAPDASNPNSEPRLFKFIDEATNLFWTGKLKAGGSDALFGERGMEFRSRTAAEEAFCNYEVTRLGMPDLNLPEVKMLVFKVELIELDRRSFDLAPSAVRLTRFAMTHGKQDRLVGFVRALSERGAGDFMDFRYIVARSPAATFDLAALTNAVLSSRKSGKKLIAIRSDADLLYLRMSLGEGFVTAYDLDTAAQVAKKEEHA
jgi:hypothetical protein